MNSTYNLRVIVTKAILWFFVGAATAVVVARYVRGLGATTALTDATPWGLWIGFDVLSGVALAAGGFVIAATVYIFHLERYHAFVRPAILTAFLGYLAVALGLMADLGRPWNIWRMIFFWQTDSPLFEVGWCVMLYLTVLSLEFIPVIFEGLQWKRALRVMRHVTLLLVIAGIGLSTLHQSSLGTLFLLARDRMHPLWYSPILPLLFFLSAIGLGLMMVATESTFTSWLYRREGEWPQLRGLTRAASIVLVLYFVVRIGDLVWRGQLGSLLDSGPYGMLFVVEMTLSVFLPVLLFTLPNTRTTHWGITIGSIAGVVGFVLHRADVGGITHIAVTGEAYVPALTEISISVGLVSAMGLIFLFCVERFPVWHDRPPVPEHFTPPIADPVTGSYFGGLWFGRAHLAGAAWIVGVVIGVALLEVTTGGGELPREIPISAARSVAAIRVAEAGNPSSTLVLSGPLVESSTAIPEGMTTALLIDGDRRGRAVLFDHFAHRERMGGEASCGRCHHHNLRLDRGTPCASCHTDMYRCNDIFDHEGHVTELGENASCSKCHPTNQAAKNRITATPCLECHENEIVDCLTESSNTCVSRTNVGEAPCSGCHHSTLDTNADGLVDHRSRCGVATGYRRAMHVLCIECHCAEQAEMGLQEPVMSRCGFCHRGVEGEATVQASANPRIADARRRSNE